MADYEAQCACGKRVRVNEFALGMRGRCPACGQIFTVDESNARPCTGATAPPPSDFADETETPRDVCARCNTAFRGNWDRVQIESGTLCYHCANLASDGLPPRLQQATTVATERPPSVAGPMREEPKLPFGIDPDARWFRASLWTLAFGTIALTIWVVQTDTTPMQRVRVVEDGAGDEMPPWVSLAVIVWDVMAGYAGVGIAMYLALRWTNHLPHDVLWKDLLYLGWILLLLTLVFAVTSAIYFAIDAATGMGPVAALLIFPLGVLAQLFVVHRLLELRVLEYVLVLVVTVLVGTLISAAKNIVFAALYLAT